MRVAAAPCLGLCHVLNGAQGGLRMSIKHLLGVRGAIPSCGARRVQGRLLP